ncbi:hypothetical protein EDB84DRAFT_1438194 [Lactarius hengduanensis]|nr:hypothetical protein EDB84DRAFT_1438194 [Lactarius hengduanensis]
MSLRVARDSRRLKGSRANVTTGKTLYGIVESWSEREGQVEEWKSLRNVEVYRNKGHNGNETEREGAVLTAAEVFSKLARVGNSSESSLLVPAARSHHQDKCITKTSGASGRKRQSWIGDSPGPATPLPEALVASPVPAVMPKSATSSLPPAGPAVIAGNPEVISTVPVPVPTANGTSLPLSSPRGCPTAIAVIIAKLVVITSSPLLGSSSSPHCRGRG